VSRTGDGVEWLVRRHGLWSVSIGRVCFVQESDSPPLSGLTLLTKPAIGYDP
jgi:hypothetical protein